MASFAPELALPDRGSAKACGQKIARWIGGIHRATSSGLGEPDFPSRDRDGERERESPFARLDAGAAEKFKGFADFLRESRKCLKKRQIRQGFAKKMPSGSGESTGQRAPAWGNRIIRPGSEDGERDRESPFAGLEGDETA